MIAKILATKFFAKIRRSFKSAKFFFAHVAVRFEPEFAGKLNFEEVVARTVEELEQQKEGARK